MRIAQITDSHIVAADTLWKGRVDTAAALQRMLDGVARYTPDLIVHTGDVVDDGVLEQYREATRILAGKDDHLRLIPGNHDDRDGLRAGFPGQSWAEGEFLSWTEAREGLRLIGLDSIVPGQTGGAVCRARLDWLDAALGQGPSLLFMHHPPCPMGLPFMDGWPFEGGEALAELIRGRGVLRVICGHVHADVERGFADTLVSAAPATSVQISPDLADFAGIEHGEPAGYTVDPPRARLMDWDGAMLSVKTVFAEPTEGPFPFSA